MSAQQPVTAAKRGPSFAYLVAWASLPVNPETYEAIWNRNHLQSPSRRRQGSSSFLTDRAVQCSASGLAPQAVPRIPETSTRSRSRTSGDSGACTWSHCTRGTSLNLRNEPSIHLCCQTGSRLLRPSRSDEYPSLKSFLKEFPADGGKSKGAAGGAKAGKGGVSLDFRDPGTTRELTRVLLKADFGVNWWVPDGQVRVDGTRVAHTATCLAPRDSLHDHRPLSRVDSIPSYS